MPTGDLCPSCGKGHLYPTGERSWQKDDLGSKNEYAKLKCDKCGHEQHELIFRANTSGRGEGQPAKRLL
ncbi:MAG: hypothetical protein ABSA92_05310 [Candidatus Bathyarchaeia archaeon]|jgi:ribosomal protein S27E